MQRENILSKPHTCNKKFPHISYMYKNVKALNMIEIYKMKTFLILVKLAVCLPLVKLLTTIDVNTCKLITRYTFPYKCF